MNTNTTQNNRTRSSQGFTLIELIFSIALISFMLTTVLVTFLGVFRFYLWSQTINANQISSRQLLTNLSKDIQSGVVDSAGVGSICINTPNSIEAKSIYYFLDVNHQVHKKLISSPNCNPLNLVSEEIISNPTLTVDRLDFGVVRGATGNSCSSPTTDCKPPLRQSVTINLDITNGFPDAVTGKCKPGDNFCNQASFITAVNETTR